MLRLAAERDTLSVVDDQHGQPTSTRALADLVVRMVAAHAPAGTYHGTASGQTTWCGFARAILEGSGHDPARVHGITTDDYPRPAARPAYGVLSHDTLIAADVEPIGDWRAGLAAHLAAG